MTFEELVAKWETTKHNAERFCFASADSACQQQALKEVDAFFTVLADHLKAAIQNPELNDNVADAVFCLSLALEGVRHELHMWIAIRDQNYHEAWDHLVSAQHACWFATKTCPTLTRVDSRLRMLVTLEHILFPPQAFLSPGIVAKYECSICHQNPISCPHIKGRLYRGQMCYHIATEIIEFNEFSLVDEPADKRRRITQYTDKGITIDKLTNGPVDDSKDAEHQTKVGEPTAPLELGELPPF